MKLLNQSFINRVWCVCVCRLFPATADFPEGIQVNIIHTSSKTGIIGYRKSQKY